MRWYLRSAVPVVLAALLSPPLAFAQAYPAKTVRVVIPWPPGGSNDVVGRIVMQKLGEALGQQFVIDNRPGAAGSIGSDVVAKAPADGYTYLFAFDTHAINPALYRNLPYDTFKDFAPVMLIGTAPQCIAAHAASRYKSMADVIRAAKAKPDSVTYGSIGSGSLGHLTLTLVQQTGGFKIVHIPYKGGGPMTVAALGGEIDLAIGTVALLTPYVKGGKLRAIAVTGDKRSSALPDVPSLAEQGFPGFSALAWWGIFAPAATPKPIMDKFHAELTKVFNLPDVRKQLAETLGMDLAVSSPAELQKFLVAEIARWGKVVREHNIRAD